MPRIDIMDATREVVDAFYARRVPVHKERRYLEDLLTKQLDRLFSHYEWLNAEVLDGLAAREREKVQQEMAALRARVARFTAACTAAQLALRATSCGEQDYTYELDLLNEALVS